jgi:radical SAM superfamily enzyme YgiQ (UPF0313 family)
VLTKRRRFCLMLIKPSHYDDDGYVITWWRSPIPSNSLATLYGLARDCAARQVLGPDVDFDIEPMDESNIEIKIPEVIRRVKAADLGMVMLIGVQSNQFPRALDLARIFRENDIQVAIGGFHVSGTISMLDGDDQGLRDATALGVSVFAGEAEGRLDDVLRDAEAGALKPLYNYMDDLPGIQGSPIPFMPVGYVERTATRMTSFDAGRGCPFQCSFCTIINVQGRISRRRTPDDVEAIIRENCAQGVHRFFITDDNFARNKDWEIIIDRLIQLREVDKLNFGLVIQVDTLSYRIPNFVDKCVRAGVRRVFLGLENINPANLMAAKKRQNKITDYRAMLLAWRKHHIITYAGYILGFPNDSFDSVMHDIDIIKTELPVDVLEFFYLTPLPGSEDHQKLYRAGTPMDPDLNKYDLNHATVEQAGKMNKAEWERCYYAAWARYYTVDHVTTLMKRSAATGGQVPNVLFLSTWFTGGILIENVHPLECGAVRKKFRQARRYGLKVESPLAFYPKYWAETVVKLARWARIYGKYGIHYLRIMADPKRREYTDLALSPVSADDENLEIFKSKDAVAYIKQQRHIEAAQHGQKIDAAE